MLHLKKILVAVTDGNLAKKTKERCEWWSERLRLRAEGKTRKLIIFAFKFSFI